MWSIVRDNGTTKRVVYSDIEYRDDAKDLAELSASEHSERIDVSYWQSDYDGNSYQLTTNNGTTITYRVERSR